MSCGTEYILGSIVSDSGCVSKLGGSCATFLGYIGIWGDFGAYVKVDLV